ncbi:hypothetical protein AGR8A_Lc10303 [Agrobacterium fabrum str. J-07]|nr:hypothetical protein AGR8A_Lc10303 [Agrobacterium fabrum str. J-07]
MEEAVLATRRFGALLLANGSMLTESTFCQLRVDMILCCKHYRAFFEWPHCSKAYLTCSKIG